MCDAGITIGGITNMPTELILVNVMMQPVSHYIIPGAVLGVGFLEFPETPSTS